MKQRASGAAAVLFCLALTATAAAQSYEVRGGRWFDGRTFVARTVFVEQGRGASRYG